jgi:carbon storage regulator CsrA
MLVLTRRLHEAVVFPELGITVRVVHVKGGAIRLGIEAPKEVAVLREELVGGISPFSPLTLSPP